MALSLLYSPFWVIYRFTAPGLPVLFLSGAYALAAVPAVGTLVRAVGEHGPHPSPPPEGEGEKGRAASRPTPVRPGDLALAVLLVAVAAVFWGTHRPGFTLESPHPYPDRADLAWVVVNPDDGAAWTSAHLARLDLAPDGDRLYLLDQDWQIRAELAAGDLAGGGWTPPIAGRFVILKLVTDGQGQGWGFRVDGVTTPGESGR
ncbi:MAG: hypothetical protein HY689_00880 [Chloroflexi bacterium]|nr:hypothetical protein [Chloroflexota bacterium]